MHFSESPKKSPAAAEKMAFQAETRKLLDIVTHSIYSDKEVFIRELISNSSDALEKLRYSMVKGSIPSSSPPSNEASQQMKIEITTDKANRTLTIVDSGIGMTREELISNLGTIARSGSKEFVQAQQQGDTGIIGQFGVGFYSSFMVAERVSVESRSALEGGGNGPVHKWTSVIVSYIETIAASNMLSVSVCLSRMERGSLLSRRWMTPLPSPSPTARD